MLGSETKNRNANKLLLILASFSNQMIPYSIRVFVLFACAIPVVASGQDSRKPGFSTPKSWRYSAPLISAEKRPLNPSHAQKDPSVVFFGGRWHVFMTVKLPERSAIEYCSFLDWGKAVIGTEKNEMDFALRQPWADAQG